MGTRGGSQWKKYVVLEENHDKDHQVSCYLYPYHLLHWTAAASPEGRQSWDSTLPGWSSERSFPLPFSLSLPLFYLSFKYPLHFDVKADYLTEVPLTCTLLSYSLYLNQQNQFPSFLSDLQWSSKILPFQWLVENSPIFAFGKCCQYLHGIKVWQLQFIYQSIRF